MAITVSNTVVDLVCLLASDATALEIIVDNVAVMVISTSRDISRVRTECLQKEIDIHCLDAQNKDEMRLRQ